MSELDARNIGYKTNMKPKELEALLKKAQAAQAAKEAKEKAEADATRMENAPPEDKAKGAQQAETMPPVDYKGILCEASTIHGLHRRICELEWKMRNA